LKELEASAALGVVFGRDIRAVSEAEAMDSVAGYTLAIDLSEPGADFFRPPIREKCRDGFLPVGPTVISRDTIASLEHLEIRLEIDGKPAATHSFDNDVERLAKLIEDISAFMTFRAGDVLLAVRTPARRAPVGGRIEAVVQGIGRLECVLGVEEEVSR
jgi:5-oxopent-3-ene-1,2,5-tricarboxylate decarboxylase/2-hydroxyhepta-2,4-diene-1,7-dioate isomerase